MKNWMKRGLSFLLVLAMVVGYVPLRMITPASAASTVASEGNLNDADGIVWLTKVETGTYAPASTELIDLLMDEQLDNMIRDAVGQAKDNESIIVKYDDMNVGSLTSMTSNFQKLNEMRTAIVDAISDHRLVKFNVGGKDMMIACRNISTATIGFAGGKLLVTAGAEKPANLAQLREAVKAALADPAKAWVEHNGKTSLTKAGAEYKINVKNAEWPGVEDDDVKIGTVTVTLAADDVTTNEPKTATVDVYIRDSRKVYTVTYEITQANGQVVTKAFKAYAGETTPSAGISPYYTVTWEQKPAATVTGNVTYKATLTVDPNYDKDNNGVDDREQSFTVTYYNGTQVWATFDNQAYGVEMPKPQNNPTSDSSVTFLGWYLRENGVDTDKPAPVVVTSDMVCYAKWSTRPVVTLHYNDRGEQGTLFFEVVDQKVNPLMGSFLVHPVAGVSSSGFKLAGGGDFDLNGTYTQSLDVYIDYFTDLDGDEIKDGTAGDPRYEYVLQIGKLDANGALEFVDAQKWVELAPIAGVSVGTMEDIRQVAKFSHIEYNPSAIGYAVYHWEIKEVGDTTDYVYQYVIQPKLGIDTNGNGRPDDDESTKLVLNGLTGLKQSVEYVQNDEGEYEAVVKFLTSTNVVLGEAVIYISGLASNGRFDYVVDETDIKVSPVKLDGAIRYYVDDVKIGAIGADGVSVVGANGYDADYNAYNRVAPKSAATEQLTVYYAAVPSMQVQQAMLNLSTVAQENLEAELYKRLLATAPAYDAEAVQVWYLSRDLQGDMEVTVKLDGLLAYAENRFGAVLDMLPEGMEFPEEITVTLPAQQWTRLEDSPAKNNASAQAVADEFINKKIKELENEQFSPETLVPMAAQLANELEEEIKAKAMLHKFGYVGAEDRYLETLKFQYSTVKYSVTSDNATLNSVIPNRVPVTMEVVKPNLSYGYACFTDADLLANVKLVANGNPVSAQLELDRVAYYGNANAGRYTVTVSFSGDSQYKPAESVSFNLEITKVTPDVQLEKLVVTADDNYNYKPVVTPGNAPIIQIIAGIESGEFALDEHMTLVDDEVTATVYVKIPTVYAQFLNGQQLNGYPVVEMGKFYTRDQLMEALEEYAAHKNLPGKEAINTVHALMDVIPDVLDSIELYDMGLKKVSYKVRIDAIDSQVRPTEPGIYVNYAASMGYVGKFLESKGNQYASLFLNDNYILSDLPGTDMTNPDNIIDLATLKGADYGLILYTPMIPVPNNGGIQLYDGEISNAQNVFVYDYEKNTVRDLEVAYNGAKLEGAEPYYYGLTTRLDPTTAVPTQPGVYIAAYTYTKSIPNQDTGKTEILRIGSDAAVIIIKQQQADLTITGGSFEYDGESKFPEITVTDSNGNKIDDASLTIISGTANVKTQGSNVTANDLYGAVNIDFPDSWTIPYLELPGETLATFENAWNYYRTTFLNKAANDKFTPSDLIAFLEFCGKKAEAGAEKAMAEFEKIGANKYVNWALDQINNQVDPYDLSFENLQAKADRLQDMFHAGKNNYYDVLIEKLRPLEALDDNVWITLQDLENMDYSATGVYLYMGAITDPDLTVDAGKGVVIIHSADDYVMHDTYVPYDGQEHSVLEKDTTSRSDINVILDRVDEAKVAVSTEKKQVHIQIDEELAQIVIDELNKILAKDEKLNLQLNLNSGGTVGAAYVKTEKIANKLTDKVIAAVRARAMAKLDADGFTGKALEFALDMLDEELESLYSKLLAKLQAIDTLDNDTRIVISDMLPVDLGTYEVTTFNFNTNKINFVLDEDLFGFIKNQLEQEGYTLNKGSNGYVITGYQKGEKVAAKITDLVFEKLTSWANAAFDKTPYETPAELTAALEAMNNKLLAWEGALSDKLQQLDNLDDYTLIVINGKLPTEVGTYDFYGFDYDVARTSATLVIEPVYIEIVADSGDKYYGTVEDEIPGATVNYYSYKTNPETLVRERVPYTNEVVIAAANLSYEVVVEKNAAEDKQAPVGTYAVTIENVSVTESDRYATPVTVVDGEYEVIPTTFTVEVTSEHTYDATEQTVQFTITDNMTGEILDPALFDITQVTKATGAEDYYFTVTAKENSGHTGSVENVQWTIQPAQITEVTATDLIYNGQTQTTTLVVKAGDLVLTENDYIVAIGTDKGTDAGDYTVTVSGTGNFTGSANDAWVISPAQITEVTATDLVYNGQTQTTTLVVKAGDLVLDAADYTVTGNTGENVATYTVKVEGKGNFTGSAETTWDITPLDITGVVATDKNYTGSEQTTDLTVTAGTLTATYEVVSGASATNAGTYTVKVAGTGNFSGELETEWTIHAADFTVEATEEYTYNRQEQNAQFVIKFNGQEISKDDFVITGVTSATNVGEYSFTVTAKAGSNYTGSYTVNWKIVPAVIDSVVATNKVYNGSEQTTTLVVKAGELVLSENEYTVTGNTGKNIAEYTATVTGTGNFAGTEDAKWNITPAQITSVEATDVTYNGQQQTAQLVVKAGDLVLTEDDYTVTGNVGTNAGDYTVKVTGKGNFESSAETTWTIKRAIINSVEAADLVYNATEQTTTVTVKADGMTATYEVISGNKGTDVNTYTVQVQGTENFQGIMTAQWDITPAQITSVVAKDYTYNGRTQTTELVVMAGTLVLTEDDYTVTGNTGKDATDYTVTVTGTGNFASSASDVWTISPAQITSVVAENRVYNGNKQGTTLVVKAGDLIVDTCTVTGEYEATDVGTYTLTVEGAYNYTGTASTTWQITPAQIDSVVATNKVYNGQVQATELTVKADGMTATYEIISGNTGKNADTYTVTVKGTGNFAGTATADWQITPLDITSATVTSTHTYTGEEQTATLKVEADGIVLNASDYTVVGNKGTEAGNYTATVTGIGNFKGTAEADWTIQNATFTVTVAGTYTYTGEEQAVQILVNGEIVDPEKFEVTGDASGKDAGDYTVTVTAKDGSNYTGEAEITWTIAPAQITSVEATNVTYNGTEQTAQLVVKAGDLVLTEADYTVTGNTATNAGDYTVAVTGKDNFTGTASDVWSIAQAQITSVVATDLVYNDAEQTTGLTVMAGTLPATYEVISGNKGTDVKTYTVQVQGTGNFTGTAEAEWKITPAVVKVIADDKTMKMNESIPALTYTVVNVSGYVDPAKLTVDMQHTVPAPNSAGQYLPGDYEIIVTAGSTANWTVEVVDGKLTVEAIDFICWNVNTGVYYDDVSDALAVASAGDVIQMLKDATATYNSKDEAIIVVGANVTFDLYGHYVETDNLLSFGAVIDTVATAAAPDYNTDSALVDGDIHSGGIVIDIDTTKAWTQLQPANAGYIPVYDTETSSYKFFVGGDAGEFNGAGGAIDAHDLRGSDGVNLARFRFRLLFKDAEAYQILGRTDDSGMKVVLNIKWSGLKAMDVTHTMGAAGVKNHATQQYPNRGTVMYFYIYDLSGIGDSGWISAQPTIVTQAGVVDVARDDAAVYTHTWGNA